MTTADTLVYQVGDFKVDVIQRQVVTPSQTISVRPKTFSLLLVFLQNPSQILQKEFLLNQVWDDVCVEEQVLVQSIRELRQVFAPLDVLQTHPRKGYAWVVPVTKAEKIRIIPPSPFSKSRKKMIGVAASLLVLTMLIAFALSQSFSSSQIPKNIITVLPVENRTEGSTLMWVRLGMMDQLIQSLQSSPHVQVFDVPYVLHLLDVAGGDMNDRIQLANRIFEISGSSVVVDLELAGSVNDYRLLYRLFTPTGQTSGVIMENQLDKVVESLAKVIAAKTDARLELSHLNKEFNSNLVAEAWDKWSKGQTDAAIALLKTAVTLEPDNFLAYQLLIESEQIQERWAQSINDVKNIIATAGQQQNDRAHVFYYLLARAEFALGDTEQAQKNLVIAKDLAEREFDSLYQAYITSLQGDIAQQRGGLDEAEGLYRKAMGHHHSIACPIGVSVTRLKLIDLYSRQKRNDLLVEQMNQLKELIAKHKLPIELPNLVMN
jgi:DNA-binding winged helix-turn-helix (wHTH) protein/tetratricopeptide (TPR) repeat protein